MRNQTRSFYKKYCRIMGRNVIIEEIKCPSEVRRQCYDRNNCPSKECCLKSLLKTVSSGV